MKKTVRILAILMCVGVLFAALCLTTNAASDGSITVKNPADSSIGVGGRTLNLFKIFNATYDGTNVAYQWYTVEKDGVTVNPYYEFFYGNKDTSYMKAESGTIEAVVAELSKMEDNSVEMSVFANDLHKYINDKGYDKAIADGGYLTATSGKIDSAATSYTFSGLDYGYYVVFDATDLTGDPDGVRSAAMVDTTTPTVEITLKVDRPTIEKFVDDDDTDGVNWKLGATVTIGDTANFKLVTSIPDHTLYESDYTFKISDNLPDGLTLDPDTVTVKVNDAAAPDGFLTATDTTGADGNEFTLTFSVDKANVGDTVEVYYSALLNENAEISNVNTATLTYSNDPNNATSTGITTDTATVYTFLTVITKYAQGSDGNATVLRLAGAEFELYRKVGDTYEKLTFRTSTVEATATNPAYTVYTIVTDTDDDTNVTTVLKTHNELVDGEAATDEHSGSNGGHFGELSVFGLTEGEYRLVETKAPNGYNLAGDPFEFVITDTIGDYGAVSTISMSAVEHPTAQIARIVADTAAHRIRFGVTNVPGSVLPETGGVGTTIFTIAGVILMVGALAFFVSRKRNSVA